MYNINNKSYIEVLEKKKSWNTVLPSWHFLIKVIESTCFKYLILNNIQIGIYDLINKKIKYFIS